MRAFFVKASLCTLILLGISGTGLYARDPNFRGKLDNLYVLALPIADDSALDTRDSQKTVPVDQRSIIGSRYDIGGTFIASGETEGIPRATLRSLTQEQLFARNSISGSGASILNQILQLSAGFNQSLSNYVCINNAQLLEPENEGDLDTSSHIVVSRALIVDGFSTAAESALDVRAQAANAGGPSSPTFINQRAQAQTRPDRCIESFTDTAVPSPPPDVHLPDPAGAHEDHTPPPAAGDNTNQVSNVSTSTNPNIAFSAAAETSSGIAESSEGEKLVLAVGLTQFQVDGNDGKAAFVFPHPGPDGRVVARSIQVGTEKYTFVVLHPQTGGPLKDHACYDLLAIRDGTKDEGITHYCPSTYLLCHSNPCVVDPQTAGAHYREPDQETSNSGRFYQEPVRTPLVWGRTDARHGWVQKHHVLIDLVDSIAYFRTRVPAYVDQIAGTIHVCDQLVSEKDMPLVGY